jgi:dTDP-4-dehydrorhamnose reductase
VSRPTILVTGATGQLGMELARLLSAHGYVTATSRAQLDLTDVDAIVNAVRSLRPRLIVNAAGYTAVDQAEREPELADAVNARAPAILAEEAKRLGAPLVHYSDRLRLRRNGRHSLPRGCAAEPRSTSTGAASWVARRRSPPSAERA